MLGFIENPDRRLLMIVSKSRVFTYSTNREMVLKLPHMVWASITADMISTCQTNPRRLFDLKAHSEADLNESS